MLPVKAPKEKKKRGRPPGSGAFGVKEVDAAVKAREYGPSGSASPCRVKDKQIKTNKKKQTRNTTNEQYVR